MRRKLIFILILILLWSGSVCTKKQILWPTQGWNKSSPEEQNVDSALLSQLDARIKNGDYGYVDSMLVIRNGYLIFEKAYEQDYVRINEGKDKWPDQYNYYNPNWHPFYKGTKLHSLQSVTKSITSALIGVAIGKKEIQSVNQKIVDIFKDEEISNLDDRKKRLTLEDVLTMRSGIDWNESIPYTDPRNTCIQLEKSDDWFKFVINRQMSDEPGTVFEYNSGASVLLSAIIKELTGMYIDKFAEKHLFKPLGISSYYWKRTPTELPDTEGGLYLEPHDLAKIGYLYLNDGMWDGSRILPEGWVQSTVTPHVADVAPDNDNVNVAYGYQWWLIPYNEKSKEYIYACSGYGGQRLLVATKYNLIAVFNGWNIYEKPSMPLRAFFDYVLKAVNDVENN
ncbi:MAG: serine hydrolase [Candidatus Aminicenantes bacterium]|nr:MAG: serine hydrolase [Candidatus Aminicenantes bacterium]